jgi:hypothetical protein
MSKKLENYPFDLCMLARKSMKKSIGKKEKTTKFALFEMSKIINVLKNLYIVKQNINYE